MKRIVEASTEERNLIFTRTSHIKNIPLSMVEKDFWVCYVLSKIFSDGDLCKVFRFKGGTSLSKGYGLINRFSEDLDLILDKRLILENEDIFKSSYKQQRKFSDVISEKTACYVSTVLKRKIETVLGNRVKVCTDEEYAKEEFTYNPKIIDNKSLHVVYPKSANDVYLRSDILLEIGVMSAPTPYEDRTIESYVAEALPQLNLKKFIVPTVKPVRTFWDKATILHREFHRPETTHTPARYSRHYHDLYKMGHSFVKEQALSDIDLLRDVVERKDKLYHCPWARYEECVTGNIHLLPNENNQDLLVEDYRAMQNMIYGEVPSWNEINEYLAELEKAINERSML